jgi:hypothetical protein
MTDLQRKMKMMTMTTLLRLYSSIWLMIWTTFLSLYCLPDDKLPACCRYDKLYMGRDVFFYNDGTGRVEKLQQQLDPGNYQH